MRYENDRLKPLVRLSPGTFIFDLGVFNSLFQERIYKEQTHGEM